MSSNPMNPNCKLKVYHSSMIIYASGYRERQHIHPYTNIENNFNEDILKVAYELLPLMYVEK